MPSSVLELWTLLIQGKKPSLPCSEIWSVTSSSSQYVTKNFFLNSTRKAVNMRLVRHASLAITQDCTMADLKL